MNTEKMIAKANKNIARKERTSTKLVKFFNTEKGEKMIKLIGHLPLTILIHHFQAPSLKCVGSYDSQMNMILSAVKQAGKEYLLPSKNHNLLDYTAISNKENAYDAARHRFVEDWQKNKSAPKLTPHELKVLNKRDQWVLKKDTNGKPIVKTVKDDTPGNLTGYRLLYDKLTGLPIYKYTPKPNPRGIAWKLHSYEVHKMAKYDKRMSIQMEIDKKGDLFPDQITEKYKMLREAHLEQLRRDLCDLYYPTSSITIITKDNETDEIKKTPLNISLRLGVLPKRGNMVGIREPIPMLNRGRTREQLMALSHAINDDKSHITCIHTNYKHRIGKIVFPEMYGLVALYCLHSVNLNHRVNVNTQ